MTQFPDTLPANDETKAFIAAITAESDEVEYLTHIPQPSGR